MPSFKRYFEENAAYFVTTVTKERKPAFLEAKLCRILLVTIEYYKEILDYKVYGYCLMPDHLHLIIRPTGKFDLAFIIKMIKGTYSRKMNKLGNKQGAVWQRRYYDEVVRSESQLIHQLDYMHKNPVAAGLVLLANEYPYSSYSQFEGMNNPLGEILSIEHWD